MNPMDALDTHRYLIEWTESTDGQRYDLSWWKRTVKETHRVATSEREDAPRDRWWAGNLENQATKAHAATRMTARMAETFVCDESMYELVCFAAATLPQPTMERTILPTDFGLVILPKTSLAPDVHGKNLGVRIFTWGAFGNAVQVVGYTDLHDHDDYTDRRSVEAALRHGGRYLMAMAQNIPFSATPNTTWQDLGGHTWETPYMRQLRWIIAFWILCRQEIAVAERPHVDRATGRRWSRVMQTPPMVTVIRLRRRKADSLGHGDEVVWHHRWIVRGHWRQQRYGPGRTLVRPVWIHPYIKGPEEAPLLQTTKVHYLVR